jgi:hypothetical protein
VAQPPPAPQSWYPAAPRRGPSPPQLIPIAFGVVLILIFVGFFLSAVAGGAILPLSFAPFFVCIPVFFVVVILIIILAQSSGQRRIPPPPPIQQPMVPAGQQGPVALNCPNCGGPPTNVDRFGIATCSYCGTRFLVR